MTEKTQHCKCGNDTYKIKWTLSSEPEIWAECSECGRKTSSVGPRVEPRSDNLKSPTTGEWIKEIENAEEGDTIRFDEANGNVENLTENQE